MVTYDKYDIVFQEIPNEVSLAFTLKNCPNRCVGCHSEHLRKKEGSVLTSELLKRIIDKYSNQITTVLFLGGDADVEELLKLIKVVNTSGLKSAVYSGLDKINYLLVNELSYYKIGKYDNELGGLNSINTNQILYSIINKFGKNKLIDITYKLQRRSL